VQYSIAVYVAAKLHAKTVKTIGNLEFCYMKKIKLKTNKNANILTYQRQDIRDFFRSTLNNIKLICVFF